MTSVRATAVPCDALQHHFAATAERERILQVAYGLLVDGELVAGRDTEVQSRICSMTKSFTAVAMLQLRDAGALDLDEPIATYVPEVAAWRYAPTVRHLLTMTGGLPTDDAFADRCLDWSEERFDAFLRAGVTFARAPGLRFEYANLGWALLGRAIANVSGTGPQDYVTAYVLRPLGLTRTTWSTDAPTLDGHRISGDEVVPEGAPLGDGAFAPMGGLWSTAADICRWMWFLIDGNVEVLADTSRAEMQTMHAFASAEDRFVRGYGYGVFVEYDEKLGRTVEHPGGLPGFGSSMRWLPEGRVGVVALANLTYAPMTGSTRAALDVVVSPASDRERVSELSLRLASLLADWRSDRERELFADNVLLDVETDERIAAATKLRRELGGFEIGSVDPVTPTYAIVHLRGARGAADLRVWLTAEAEPRIQSYEVKR